MTRTVVVPFTRHTQASLRAQLNRVTPGSRPFAAAHLGALAETLPPDADSFHRCAMPVGDGLCLLPSEHPTSAGCIAPPRGYRPEVAS